MYSTSEYNITLQEIQYYTTSEYNITLQVNTILHYKKYNITLKVNSSWILFFPFETRGNLNLLTFDLKND